MRDQQIFKYKDSCGKYRMILATGVSIKFENEHYHKTFDVFTVTLETTEAHFYYENNSFTFSGITTSPYNVDIDNVGTAESQPRVFIAFQSASGVTDISIDL